MAPPALYIEAVALKNALTHSRRLKRLFSWRANRSRAEDGWHTFWATAIFTVFRNFGIPANTVNSIFTGVTYKSWALTHTRIFSPTCFMSLLHTNTEITLRIEPVTGARFDFIPSLPSRLSLGLSHKQSPSSRSRYEISFVGCWQVPHVGSATCVSLSYLCVFVVCVCVWGKVWREERSEWSHIHTHEFIDQWSRPDVQHRTRLHPVVSQRQLLTYSSAHLSYTDPHIHTAFMDAHTHTHTLTDNHLPVSLPRARMSVLAFIAGTDPWRSQGGVKCFLWYGTHTQTHTHLSVHEGASFTWTTGSGESVILLAWLRSAGWLKKEEGC